MAFIDLKFYSEALKMQSEVYVVIPQRNSAGEIGIENNASQEKYKCLYLLHGLSEDHTIWTRRTSIERYAAQYGICVVMPCAHRSFYTNMKYGGDYYTYIAKEVPRIVREFLPVSEKREDNFIAGLSMGGYGALKIGLREGASFCAAAGISSVADIRQERFTQEKIAVWGEEQNVPPEDDLFSLAELSAGKEMKPRLFMSVGTQDFMYKDNVRLKEKIEGLSFDFTYVEKPGAHTWEFWDDQIKSVLAWMLQRSD